MKDHQKLDLNECIRIALLIDEGGLSGRTIRQLAGQAGSFRALLSIQEKTLLELVGGPPDRIVRLTRLLRETYLHDRLSKVEQICRQFSIQAMVCDDPRYPERLKRIGNHPAVLFWRGVEPEKAMEGPGLVTVVGTRRPTGYGRIMTERIAQDLARAGLVIISGLARGVDTLAHKAALEVGRPTIGVLAGGVDNVYPPENRTLVDRICETGSVISEHLPGTMPIRQFFPARNRILSGLSDAVIVTEASLKSGSMITASFAADQGRDVFAMPGNVMSPESEGCNRLIREGAYLLGSADDVLWRLPTAQRMDLFSAAIKGEQTDDLSSEMLRLLAGGPLTIDDLSIMLETDLPTMLCLLSDLEIRGKIQRERGRFALTAG